MSLSSKLRGVEDLAAESREKIVYFDPVLG